MIYTLKFQSIFLEDQMKQLIARISKIRSHKTITFLDYMGEDGKCQVVLKADIHERMKTKLMVGDVMTVKGEYGFTKSNQYSLFAKDVEVLARSDHVIPFGNAHCNNRTEELIVSDQLQVLRTRFKILQDVRNHFLNLDFVEVETPILHPLYGGANATPFKTFCRATEKNVYMRIAPELYLKRLIIAGMPKIFEIAKVFRNEGIDQSHHPEFTMCEAYQADSTLEDWISLTRTLLLELFQKYLKFQPKIEIINAASFNPLNFESLVEKIVAKYQDTLVFVVGTPKLVSLLAKQGLNGNPNISKSFEVYYNKMELINCYEEENNATIQEAKFKEYLDVVDEDYLAAMRLGMPPTTGWGIGIDRLVMLLTNTERITHTIPFPLRGRK